jgi:hypothetical protein
MKKFNYLIILCLSAGLLFSCTKTGSATPGDLNQIDQNDDVFPVLTVIKPVNNQQYSSGDSIVVQGYITDDKVLYKGSIKITDDASSTVVKNEVYETHFLQKIDFYVAYKASVTTIKNYTINIDFQDHGANAVSQVIKVKVNP